MKYLRAHTHNKPPKLFTTQTNSIFELDKFEILNMLNNNNNRRQSTNKRKRNGLFVFMYIFIVVIWEFNEKEIEMRTVKGRDIEKKVVK